jgi:serine/threonine-protein phosphatase PGAM5
MQASPARWLLTFLLGIFLTASACAADAPVRTLYLIRHGQYDPVRGADSKTGNALNALGLEQARLVAERLAGLPVPFTKLVSSEFTRARETAEILGARLSLGVERDALLNETMPPGYRVTAEPQSGAEEQLDSAWRHYNQPSTADHLHELLVCHGNVIRWFVCRALGVDPTRWTRFEIANASLTIIQVQADGSTRVQLFNEVAHLPLEKQTWSSTGPQGWLAPQP